MQIRDNKGQRLFSLFSIGHRICCSLVSAMIVLFCLSVTVRAIADDDDWHTFTSSKYHFSVEVPGNFKEGSEGGATIFQSTFDKGFYSLVVSDYGDETPPDSADSVRSLINKHWPEWSDKMFDSGSSHAEDVTGKGWVGVQFTATKKDHPVSGIFGGSKQNMFCAFVMGNADDEEKNRFTDSFAVEGGGFDSSSPSDSDSSSSPPKNDSDSSKTGSDDTSSSSSSSTTTSEALGGLAVILICLGIGFLFLIGTGVGVFLLIKRNNKKSP